jgi:hypothetical protein
MAKTHASGDEGRLLVGTVCNGVREPLQRMHWPGSEEASPEEGPIISKLDGREVGVQISEMADEQPSFTPSPMDETHLGCYYRFSGRVILSQKREPGLEL